MMNKLCKQYYKYKRYISYLLFQYNSNITYESLYQYFLPQ